MNRLLGLFPLTLIKKSSLKFQLGDFYGGLARRIDHNLEVLEMMLRGSPELLNSDPFLINKLIDNDRFFVGLFPTLEKSGYDFSKYSLFAYSNHRRKIINKLLMDHGFKDQLLDELDEDLKPVPPKRLVWTSS